MKDEERVPIVRDFLKYCYHELQIKSAPKIRLHSDNKHVKYQKSFGGYYPQQGNIEVYTKNRNLADILRTLAHELVHHRQKELAGNADVLDGSDGSDYENEANSKAGVLLRKYGSQNPMIYESISMMSLLEAVGPKWQIYCDMDGVLCDFVAQFEHYFGIDPATYENERGYPSMKSAVDGAGREFWSEMPWLSSGERLWEKIGKYGVIILTSPSTFKDAKAGKLEWINLHLSPAPKSVIFKQTGQKHEVLASIKDKEQRKKSVLIDDWEDNLIPWKSEGGTPIHHMDDHPAHYQIDKFDLDSEEKEEPDNKES
jgi:hypothetical protein